MLLVLSTEVDPAARYLVDELAGRLPDCRTYDYPARGGRPDLDGVDGVVVSGSTAGVYEAEDHPWMDDAAALLRDLVARRVPTLGVCFGHQLANAALGGRVEPREPTSRLVEADLRPDPLFEGVGPVLPAVHGDHVVECGDGLDVLASTDHCRHFATRHRDAPLWTVQFHPEFTASLLPRVAGDFGWTDTDHSFADVTAVRVLANFADLATGDGACRQR